MHFYSDQVIEIYSGVDIRDASIRGDPPDRRRSVRHENAAPLIDDLEAWLHLQLTQISGKSALTGAIRYGLTQLKRLRPHLDDGRLSIDNNAAERGMRSIAIGREIICSWAQTTVADRQPLPTQSLSMNFL
jgi:transposase